MFTSDWDSFLNKINSNQGTVNYYEVNEAMRKTIPKNTVTSKEFQNNLF